MDSSLVTHDGADWRSADAYALCRAAMFGGGVNENITISMRQQQRDSVPARLSMWLVVVSPATKFAMTMAPIAMAVEVNPRPANTLAVS